MRKVKKTVYIHGSGDSKELNTNPWQHKELEYRYTNENYVDNTIHGRGVGLKAINFSKECKEASRQGRLARIKREEREINSLARSSFSTVPALRALARFSDMLKGTARERAVVRYDVNPLLQYNRTLLECAKLWDVAGSGEETSFVFNSNFSDGVGIEYGRREFFTHSGVNKGIDAGLYRSNYLQIKGMERNLAKFSGLLANNTLANLTRDETVLFAKNFINNIHRFSRNGVEVGIYMNMIEDELVSNDNHLRRMGMLLNECYLYAEQSGLDVTESLPKYSVLQADDFLRHQHDTVIIPTLSTYLSKYFKNYSEYQVVGLYSEVFDRMGSVRLLGDEKITAKGMVSDMVAVDAKIERIEIMLRSYFYALAESTKNPRTVSKIVSQALMQLRSEVDINELVDKISSRLGGGFEYVGKNLRSMDAAY